MVYFGFFALILGHQLISIALNSTSKFKTRLLPTIIAHLQKKGKLAKRIVFALAALIRLYKGDTNGLKDKKETLEFFKKTWLDFAGEYEKLVQNILSNKEIWGEDLPQIDGLASTVSIHLEAIMLKEFREILKGG